MPLRGQGFGHSLPVGLLPARGQPPIPPSLSRCDGRGESGWEEPESVGLPRFCLCSLGAIPTRSSAKAAWALLGQRGCPSHLAERSPSLPSWDPARPASVSPQLCRLGPILLPGGYLSRVSWVCGPDLPQSLSCTFSRAQPGTCDRCCKADCGSY